LEPVRDHQRSDRLPPRRQAGPERQRRRRHRAHRRRRPHRTIGDNGKILIFPTAELPEMPRGKGVKLQAYREGGLRDAMAFNAETGAAWIDAAGRNREWPEWREWSGRRAAAGKLAPKGFPTTKRFRPK
jgi:hypothetical protein